MLLAEQDKRKHRRCKELLRLNEEIKRSVEAAEEGKAREADMKRKLLKKRKRLKAIEREKRDLEKCIHAQHVMHISYACHQRPTE